MNDTFAIALLCLSPLMFGLLMARLAYKCLTI